MTKRSNIIIVLVTLFILLLIASIPYVMYRVTSPSLLSSYTEQHYNMDENECIAITLNNKEIASIQLNSLGDLVTTVYAPQSFLLWATGEPRLVTTSHELDVSLLRKWLETLYIPYQNAEIVHDEETGKYELIPEVTGRQFDVDAVVQVISSRTAYAGTYDLAPYVQTPTVRSVDLREEFEKVSWLNDWHITYADTEIELTVSNMDDWKRILHDYAKEVDQIGKATVGFTTQGGKTISVKYATFGYDLDEAVELEEVQSLYERHVSQDNRSPVLTGTGTLADDYIEISIADQHVWHIKNGEVVSDSVCVTGTPDGTHDTPYGVYYLLEKVNGKYLRPEDAKSSTLVNKWMRVTWEGVGLHDAYWRNAFGGEIYKKSGSHGCINLPPDFADTLYDECYVGEPVIIY